MFLFWEGPPDGENTVGHVDSDDSAVPHVPSQHPVEGGENLIDRRSDNGATEEYRVSAHPDAQVGQHRRAQRDFTAQSAYATALNARCFELQFVEESFGHECLLCTGVQSEMQRDTIAALQSYHGKSHPEHIAIGFRSRARWITKAQDALAVVDLQIELPDYIEPDDAIDLDRLAPLDWPRLAHSH